MISAKDNDYIDIDGKIVISKKVKRDGTEDVQLKWESFRSGNKAGFSSDYIEMFLPDIDENDIFTVGPFEFKAKRWHGSKAWLECEKLN